MAGSDSAGVDPQLMANAIRALTMDAVEKAASGHPGMPMGMADIATVLFSNFLKFDASSPDWPDRDRFILSAGHGSMLIYALGYLLGYPGVELDDLKAFRQLGSKTAGHPEFGLTPGVETTTGPLGQGFANAVGMAIAEAHLNARFGADLVDHYTYCVVGDGCLMEGLSQEALSLAGHLQLRKLIVLFDDNQISIDGALALADDTRQLERFAASGWATARIDGHDPSAIERAIAAARSSDKPTVIACKTIIGRGAPTKAGTAATHGAPLGVDEVAGARKVLDWPHGPFDIPDTILSAWRGLGARGRSARDAWRNRLESSDQRKEFEFAMAGEYAQVLRPAIAALKAEKATAPKKTATRQASGMTLEVINTHIAETIGGSADLTGSNNTKTKALSLLNRDDYAGRYIHYGVREHAMAGAMNGMALHGGVTPYGGTFLVFTDYCRASIRLAAMMGLRVIYVMTHDSIGLGEDGPTHQPVEHLASLRAIPNLNVFRPCDVIETAECWELALSDTKRPSVIALTRQGVEQCRTVHTDENLTARGAYVIAEAENYVATIVATGSEVEIAVAAKQTLDAAGTPVRVVSAPSFAVFGAQPAAYRSEILGQKPRVGVEAALRQGWDLFLGPEDGFIGMDSFGASAPGADLYRHFDITAQAVVRAVDERIK